MNPFTPCKIIAKTFVFTLSLPFLLLGLVVQGVAMLFAGIMSLAMLLLSVGVIVAAFVALAFAPWLMHKHAQSEKEHSRMVEQLSDGTLKYHRDIHFVGPTGQRRPEMTKRKSETVTIAEPAELMALAADLAATSTEGETVTEASSQTRPDWIDEIMPSDLTGSRILVKGQQCESAEACEVAYRDAVAESLCDYVRGRAEICLFDLGVTKMPWHDVTVQRIAQSLRVQPKAEYLDTHDTDFGGAPLRTYLKYGLLEVSPAMRNHVDGEVTRWTRSFQAASYWGMLMSAVAGLYLFVKVDVPGRISRRWNRNTKSSAVVA